MVLYPLSYFPKGKMRIELTTPRLKVEVTVIYTAIDMVSIS